MEFWTRSATVQVGDKTYSMSDFDFDFDVQFEDSKEPTTAVVTIYNLAETTRNSMKKGDPVIAGQQNLHARDDSLRNGPGPAQHFRD